MKALPVVKIYLAEKQLFFFLLDLMMGRDSPFMKYHPKVQDIPDIAVWEIYSLIQTLICSKKNFVGQHSNHPDHSPFFETTAMEAQLIRSKAFYKRIFRRNYDNEVLTTLIFHYSIKDFEYTAMICEILLQ